MKIPIDELVIKAGHLALREIGQAPEHRAARSLRDQARDIQADPSGRKVLFFTPRNWASHVQWEAMIAQALRLRGASVSFLGCGGGLEVCDRNNTYEAPPMPCRSCTKYVSDAVAAHGFDRVALDYSGHDPAWPELDTMSVSELYAVEWEGIPLGRLSMIPTQWFNLTTSANEDPLAPITIRRFLRSGRRVAMELLRHLDQGHPDVLVLLNGLFFFESIAWEIARQRGIEVVTYERGFVRGTLVFRRNACACHFDHGAWWDTWSKRVLTETEEARLSTFLAARQTGGESIDTYWNSVRFTEVERSRPGRLAVMFTNLTWDSAVIGKQLAFDSIHEWIADGIEHFLGRPDDELIIRVHPAESKLRGKSTREPVEEVIRRKFETLPENVRVVASADPTSSYTLMEQADVGLVYTSTTGMELALLGTPVLVAGNTHYRAKGFTVDAEDSADFHRLLDGLLDQPEAFAPDVGAARRYASLFFFGAPIEFPFVEEPRLGLARITTARLEDLAPGCNDDLDRVCDGIMGIGDFGPRA